MACEMPDAQAVDQAGDLLQAGAGGGDHADRPAPHHVGEAERHAVDDRRAAVGTHHQQAAALRVALERDLVGDRHVVAEEHDVEAEAERLHRLGGRIFARHRDQREVGAGARRRAPSAGCAAAAAAPHRPAEK